MNYSVLSQISSFNDFRIYDGNIGCSMSGGADSTMVMYLLMKYSKKPIKFYFTNATQKPNRIIKAEEVYDKCLELTGCTNSELVITDVDGIVDSSNLFLKPMADMENNVIDVIYTGITKVPNIDIGYEDQVIPKRRFDGGPELDEDNFYQPFVKHDKSVVAALYSELNLMESLFPLTFSCINSTDGNHCNSCWWCKERVWAFGHL